MNGIFPYLLEVTIASMIFYAAWRIFIQNKTPHSLSRFFILSSILSSFILPLINIDISESKNLGVILEYAGTVNLKEITVFPGNPNNYFEFVISIYSVVALFLLLKFIVVIIRISSLAYSCETVYYKNTKIHITKKEINPFSFADMIFVNENELNRDEFIHIFEHEKVHVKQKHSYDIILFELLAIINWLNPIMYIWKKDIKLLHEYLSDEKVILQGFDSDEYKLLLLKRQTGLYIRGANYFNKSLTLKRIQMMTNKKSRKHGSYRFLILLPVMFILFISFAFSTKKIMNNEQIVSPNPQDTIYDEVDEMPQFEGGDLGLRTYIAEHLKYPEYSKKNAEEGVVYLSFMVDKTGKVKDVKVMKGVTEHLNNEALRVISMLPDFEKPGKKDGKAVNVYYTIPVTFKLK